MASNIYQRRFDLSSRFLSGRGIELGAGISPQRLPQGVEGLYFDNRTKDELSRLFGAPVPYQVYPLTTIRSHFPEGADFLIAHHVLEHTCDPIGTLRNWHSLVRPGGTYVISVPYFALCPDRDRLLPDLEHLLLDHLLGRNGDSFESREHVLSFLCSWVDDSPGLASLDKSQCCRRILSESKRSGHDFHWHAFDHRLFRNALYAAALLDGSLPNIHYFCDPKDNVLDILAVYTLECPLDRVAKDRAIETILELRSIARKLQLAETSIARLCAL